MTKELVGVEINEQQGDPGMSDFFIIYARHVDENENDLFTLYLAYDDGRVTLSRDVNEAILIRSWDEALEIEKGFRKSAVKAMQTAVERNAPHPAAVITGIKGYIDKKTVH